MGELRESRESLINAFSFAMIKNMEIPHVRVGIGVFVFKDGKFAFLQRQGAHGEGTWSIPGGHLEFGESFEETAAREVLEETGIAIQNIRFGAVTNDIFEAENRHYTTVWMLSDWRSGELEIKEPNKCAAVQWVDFETLPEPLFLPWNQLLQSDFLESIKAAAR
jgi:8-oxo-dGTP diphosphatase